MSARISIRISGGECRIEELLIFMRAANSAGAEHVEVLALADGSVDLICAPSGRYLDLTSDIIKADDRDQQEGRPVRHPGPRTTPAGAGQAFATVDEVFNDGKRQDHDEGGES